jgi:hypothetical protein
MSTEALDPKEIGRARLAERRLRARRLRRTAVSIAVALFVAVWGLIFVTLITGNDPVLSAKARTAATAGSAGDSSSSSAGSPVTSVTSGSGSSSSAAGVSSVTTQQS